MTEVPTAAPRVLIVDDNAMLSSVVSRLLKSGGHEVRDAASAEAALQILDGPQGFRPQIILLDASLGPKSGLKAIKDLAARSKAAIVVMSGLCDEEMRRNALQLGARAVLEKPLDFKALEALMRDLAADA